MDTPKRRAFTRSQSPLGDAIREANVTYAELANRVDIAAMYVGHLATRTADMPSLETANALQWALAEYYGVFFDVLGMWPDIEEPLQCRRVWTKRLESVHPRHRALLCVPEEREDTDGLLDDLERVTSALPVPRGKEVLFLRYGIHDGELRTNNEVGKVIGVTYERARQIKQDALRVLRCKERARHLEAWLR